MRRCDQTDLLLKDERQGESDGLQEQQHAENAEELETDETEFKQPEGLLRAGQTPGSIQQLQTSRSGQQH